MTGETTLPPLTDSQVARIQSNSLGLGVSHFSEANIDARPPAELTARLYATLYFREYPLYRREADRIFERLRENPKAAQGPLAQYRRRLYGERGAVAALGAAIGGLPLRRRKAIDLDLEKVEDFRET